MPPVVSGSFVVGEFVQDWTTIKSGTPCILVSKEEGIVFKFLYSHLDENQTFLLVSSNRPFSIVSIQMVQSALKLLRISTKGATKSQIT